MSTAPILTPITAVDTSTASSGNIMMSVLVDTVDMTDHNLIQIEYYLSTAPYPTSGFVTMDAGIYQSGVVNQLNIDIPSPSNDTDYTGDTTVKVRAYLGDLTQQSIVVTPWSEEQAVYVPPFKPENVHAFLSNGEQYVTNDDLLYVELDVNNHYFLNDNPEDELAVKFIVTYTYTDIKSVQQWRLSDLLEGSVNLKAPRRILLPYIQINPDDVDVTQPITVAVNAVYPYQYPAYPASGSVYYSISELSSEVSAIDSNPGAPVLNELSYKIYEATPSQEIVVKWTPAIDAAIPGAIPDSYTVYMDDGSANEAVHPDPLSTDNTSFTYVVDPSYRDSTDFTKFTFTVVATFNTLTATSNAMSINSFVYPNAPQNLKVTEVLYADNYPNDPNVSLSFQFENPSVIGQMGTGGERKFIWSVTDDSGTVLSSNVDDEDEEINYDATADKYKVETSFASATQFGTIKVYMQITDTNSDDLLNGAEDTQEFYVLQQFAPVYKIYDEATPSQEIELSWSDVDDSAVTSFDVYMNDGSVYGASAIATELPGTSTSYTWEVPLNYLNETDFTTFKFYIQANYSNGDSYNSNTTEINSFNPPTVPTSLIVRYAKHAQNTVYENDTDPNLLDIYFSFGNPDFIGQMKTGGERKLKWSVTDDFDNVLKQGDFNYVASTSPAAEYNVRVNDIPTTIASGKVVVYMEIPDTNSTNLEDGASGVAAFNVVDVPEFENVNVVNDNLEVVVTSGDDLGIGNKFIVPSGNDLQEHTFGNIPGPGPGNGYTFASVEDETTGVVTLTYTFDNGYTLASVQDETTGVFTLTYTFQPAFFGNSLPETYAILVSNSTGIAHYISHPAP